MAEALDRREVWVHLMYLEEIILTSQLKLTPY